MRGKQYSVGGKREEDGSYIENVCKHVEQVNNRVKYAENE